MMLRNNAEILKHFHILITAATLCHFSTNNALAKSPNSKDSPSATVYPDSNKKPPFFKYSDDPGLWANFKFLIKHYELPKMAQICVTGTFLLYAQPDYSVLAVDSMRLISGVGSCFSPTKFQSMQLVTPAKASIHEPSISFFRQPFLQGRAISFLKSWHEVTESVSGRVDSLIIHGDKSYTVISATTGKRYCLRPGSKAGKASKDTICLKLYNRLKSGAKDNFYSEAFQGCSNTTEDVYVDDCRKSGSGTLEQLKIQIPAKKEKLSATELQKNWRNKAAAMNANKDPNAKWLVPPRFPPQISKCNENKELLELMEMRMKSDFSSPFQLFYPKDKKQAWRTELLDNAFDTVLLTCPDVVVSEDFLALMREFYIFLAEKLAWSKGKGVPDKYNVDLEEMIDATDNCNFLLARPEVASDFIQYPLMATEDLEDHPTFSEEHYDFRLKPFRAFSTVMEAIWLVFNSAASICHNVLEYESNFIDDYIPMFFDMYLNLEPLKQEWLHPGRLSSYIPTVFGGVNVSRALDSLAICSTTVFHFMPTLDVIPRPSGFPQSEF